MSVRRSYAVSNAGYKKVSSVALLAVDRSALCPEDFSYTIDPRVSRELGAQSVLHCDFSERPSMALRRDLEPRPERPADSTRGAIGRFRHPLTDRFYLFDFSSNSRACCARPCTLLRSFAPSSLGLCRRKLTY